MFLGRERRRRRIRFRRNRGRFSKSKGRKEETKSVGKKRRRGRKILLKLLRNVGRVHDIYLESYFPNSVQDLQYENPSSSRRNRKVLRRSIYLLGFSLHLVAHLVRLYDEIYDTRRNRRNLHAFWMELHNGIEKMNEK